MHDTETMKTMDNVNILSSGATHQTKTDDNKNKINKHKTQRKQTNTQ